MSAACPQFSTLKRKVTMSDEKPMEYYAEFIIRVKERGSTNNYAQDIFCQRVNWDYIQVNPQLIPKVIAVINKLEVPNV
jgi:hypothetical protein